MFKFLLKIFGFISDEDSYSNHYFNDMHMTLTEEDLDKNSEEEYLYCQWHIDHREGE